MSYDLTGVIRHIEPEQTYPSGFSKREFVVTTNDKYPQDVKLEFVKDKCVQLDHYQPGDPVKVSFNIRGNEYEGRFFVNLVAWRIEADGATAAPTGRPGPPPQAAHARAPAYAPPANTRRAATRQTAFYGEEDGDDIPF